MVVRIAGTVTLARLISPLDYGVFGMAATVHGFAYVFQDFGLATVTLRKPDLTEAERNSLFWLNLILGALLAVFVAATGFIVAEFFHEPKLRALVPLMGITFLINGGHTQLKAQLAREHRFGELNLIEIGAFTSSTVAAIAAAILGGGAWALATMMLVAEAALAIGVWSRQKWRPGPCPAIFGALEFLPAGASLSTNDGLRYLQRNFDLFVVGRWLGAGALGIYGRAAQVASLPIIYLADPLSNLAVSTLRRLSDSPEGARAFWRRMVNDLAWVTLPAAVMFACVSREILEVLLGHRWAAGAGVLSGLSPGIALMPLQMACGWLFLATGSNRRLLFSSLLNTVVVIGTCATLRNEGTASIAIGIGVANALGAVALLGFIRPADPVSAGDALAAFARPMIAAAALGISLIAVLHLLGEAGSVARLCAGAAVGTVWLAAAWLLWPGARNELKEHFLWHRK